MLDVRLLQEEDIDETISLINRCFHIKNPSQLYKNMHQYSCNGKSLVALYNQKIVGHIFFEEKYSYEDDQVYYWLSYFCIDKDFRRKKLATKMLNKVVEIAYQNQIAFLKFYSFNYRKAAHACYQKLGYQKVDTTVFQKNICIDHEF